jgi:hypothetical protein
MKETNEDSSESDAILVAEDGASQSKVCLEVGSEGLRKVVLFYLVRVLVTGTAPAAF